MFDTLLSYIKERATTPLSKGDADIIQNNFTPKRFRKGQYFLQEGQVCTSAAFIVKGAMRLFSINGNDAEKVVDLAIENWWAVDRESFLALTPSHYNIDAWEDTDVLILKKTDYYDHLATIPAMAEMLRTLDERHASASQKRVHSLLNHTAEQRYANLLETHPEFVHRFPQYIIASYLGIAKETLSRLRGAAVVK